MSEAGGTRPLRDRIALAVRSGALRGASAESTADAIMGMVGRERPPSGWPRLSRLLRHRARKTRRAS